MMFQRGGASDGVTLGLTGYDLGTPGTRPRKRPRALRPVAGFCLPGRSIPGISSAMPLRDARNRYSGVMSPWLTWALVMTVISVSEYLLMLALPMFLPAEAPKLLEAAVDAVLLMVMVGPALWWLILRPLRRAADQRDRFLGDLFFTIESERRRIAHELHDGLGQTITLLVSGLRSLDDHCPPGEVSRRGAELRQLAKRALADTKQLALGLRPSLLDDFGLAVAIERVAADVREHHHLRVNCDVKALDGVRLPELQETALFRIFQEAVQNVVKHSRATMVEVQLTRGDQAILLEICDDGCGLDLKRVGCPAALAGHLGLIGMSERAALAGGVLQIDSSPGHGVRLRIEIPETTRAP